MFHADCDTAGHEKRQAPHSESAFFRYDLLCLLFRDFVALVLC